MSLTMKGINLRNYFHYTNLLLDIYYFIYSKTICLQMDNSIFKKTFYRKSHAKQFCGFREVKNITIFIIT